MYIMIIALIINGSITTVTQEFSSQETCKTAVENSFTMAKEIAERNLKTGVSMSLIQIPIMACAKK